MDALLSDETLPRTSPVGDGVQIILRGVYLNENASPEDMDSSWLWIYPHRIISLQTRKLHVVGDLAANIEERQGPVDCAGFITMLISLLFD